MANDTANAEANAETIPATLLSNCTSGGCGAKIESASLLSLLAGLKLKESQNLIVGFDSCDDAAVYRLDEKRSLVFTVDFFPPMVDNPKTFGRIAAANALSDVWAMGATAALALNLVCFPETMDKRILAEIIAGGAEKITEAGATLAGGHSIYDREPKYGLAVAGIVETEKVLRNNTPAAGHKLILTKPLGTGIIMGAARAGEASGEAVQKAIAVMERLNKYAAQCMAGFHISACTDITGFGLLVHSLEMAGEGATIRIDTAALPLIPEALEYAGEYLLTAAGARNRSRVENSGGADVSGLPFALQELLFDPQTSGGLLIAAAAQDAQELLLRIKESGDTQAAVIGEVIPKADSPIMFM
ncbi:MAG: selenide, water dikinase SelD [Spirochaetes bacterium]|nr:selenide, water dikinase SelD [Spirochaetota bacterium]